MPRTSSLDVTAIGLTHPGANGVVGTGSDDTAYNLLSDTMGGTLTLNNVLVNAQGITSLAEQNEAQAASAVLELRAKSTATNAVRAQDLTVFTVGGTAYLADLRGFNLGLSFTHDEGKGVGSKWLEPNVVGVGYSGDAELLIDNGAANALQVLGFGTDAATALDVALAFTLNSVAFSFPMVIASTALGFERQQLQRLNVNFSGNGLESANTGVTSLLAAAVNDPRTFVQAIVTNSATNGRTYTGNYVFDSVQIAIQDQNIVETTYRLRSTGAVTIS
jgi:hypothetical protein